MAVQAGKPSTASLWSYVPANQDATAVSYDAVCRNASEAKARRCSKVVPPSATAASTSPYDEGSTTTATDGWFLAAARTIVGPPMSICSTHSSGAAPLATVWVKG